MIAFEDYVYYPTLRSRPAEMLGYKNLSSGAKAELLPLFTLGLWPRQSSLSESINNAVDAAGGKPFIVDLARDPLYQTSDLKELLDSGDGFSKWRKFVAKMENVIPVVQIPSGARYPQIIKQTRALASSGLERVAFRITNYREETTRVVTALSALDDPQQAITFIDLNYIRDSFAASVSAAISVINDIREEVPEATICVLSTSFPSSVTAFLDARSLGTIGTIPILERDFYFEIGPDACIYGDHGSIHARPSSATGGRFTPRIDYPLIDAWEFERRPETDSKGFIDASNAIIKRFPEIIDDDYWGSKKIVDASNGDIEGMKTPSAWIAARVNIHIHRQLEYSRLLQKDGEEDLDSE